jgi:arsenate reductase (thioredoxin)
MNLLFVCIHNAGRSQMAEAITNHLASEAGLAVQAKSAGTVGGKQLNPQAIEVLNEIGISLNGHEPKFLTPEMVSEADHFISMGCGVGAEACPTRFLLTEDWELDDPAGQDIDSVRVIRDQIVKRVKALLTKIENSRTSTPHASFE